MISIIKCVLSSCSNSFLAHKNMYDSQSSFILKLLTLSCLLVTILATTHHSLPDTIVISCGSSGNTTAQDGRNWMGDSRIESTFPFQIKGKHSNSGPIHHKNSIPYNTARASRHEFSYVFHVGPGQKFIRLHFYRDSYRGFKGSTALFSVKAGPYTLVSNFSTSVAADVAEIVKEYCVNIEEDQELSITFTPAGKTRKADDFYAFVNGIEVVSMPAGLYFTPEGEFGTRVVGKKYRFYIDGSTALELVQRLNVGGSCITPDEDSGMFRRWDEDTKYLSGVGDVVVTSSITGHESTSVHIAPTRVHQLARTITAYSNAKSSLKGLTWTIPVDLGFRYLIRLHSFEFQMRSGESSDKKFSIVVNNQIAVDSHDMFLSDGEFRTYRDYVVMVEGNKAMGKRDLTIAIQPSYESRDEQFHGTLNGLEVFKLSNPDNNLAGMSPDPELQSSKSKRKHKKPPLAKHANLIVAILTVILALLNIVVYHLKSILYPNTRRANIRSLLMEHLCRQFSIEEIRESTNDFDPQFQIGSGGYGRVYKGSINRGDKIVAIKRLKLESRQGENEFRTEIKMLSKIRNKHLVSLIGYCNDGPERLLVYQYMARGTVSDHLFKINRQGKLNPPLPWELRLQISIGAARGLYYLHSRHRVIHRDVKSSNILLDENWVAKISDFGLSKMGPANDSFTHISTNVKGTFGYLDPEYFLTRKLTRKSDVYSFGVVLFEVLSGRPAVDIRLEEEQHSLAGWARYCIREGKVDRLIDPHLIEQISPACLKVFVGIAGRCLHIQPQGRPAMADVVMGLELALVLQQSGDVMEQGNEEENPGRSDSDHSDGVISMDDISITPPKGESDRMSEDKSSLGTRNGSSDRKNTSTKKTMGSNNSMSRRWWWDPFGFVQRTPSKSLPQVIIHQFSLQEIQKATNNFHNSHIIGFGGSDNVYKGYIDGGRKAVAIRWSKTTESRLSMANELQSKKEIQLKATPGQDHVVSLIGYCETETDTMLVYDYMTNGTLHDQLHESNKNPLPWKRRLQICIGAIRGVRCIHSIINQSMLHRHMKSTNIWLDENWIPKVSEWGLSRKKGKNHVPTVIRGTWGCLDSDYIRGEELTEKSYVYTLGLLLFEVLFAERESDRWFDEDQVNLAQWIKSCMAKNLAGCIDPFLIGRISPDSLETFVVTAGRCLLDQGTERPSISDIETRLETALKQQEATEGQKEAQLTRS